MSIFSRIKSVIGGEPVVIAQPDSGVYRFKKVIPKEAIVPFVEALKVDPNVKFAYEGETLTVPVPVKSEPYSIIPSAKVVCQMGLFNPSGSNLCYATGVWHSLPTGYPSQLAVSGVVYNWSCLTGEYRPVDFT